PSPPSVSRSFASRTRSSIASPAAATSTGSPESSGSSSLSRGGSTGGNPRSSPSRPLMPSPNAVRISTDGACPGNPRAGGWAAIVIDGMDERELVGGERPTTNQRMEIMGAIEGLRSLTGRRRVEIYSDSAYLVNCFRDKWYERWRRNGWKNVQKRPVGN